MPFAGYDDFDACVADNQDVDDPEAYCAAIKRQVEGSFPEDIDAETRERAEQYLKEDTELSATWGPVFQLAQLESEPIRREELGDNEVLYENIKVLQSGIWTDSGSRETIWYSPEGIENLEVSEDNAVNIMHDSDNEVSQAGHIQEGSLQAEDGALYADIVIDTSKAAGEYADENLQKTLETKGAKGFGGPSVEIDAEGQQVEYNDEKGLKEFLGGILSGLGFVSNPASKPTAFARQTAKRGVALSSGEQTKVFHPRSRSMADPDFKAQVLSHIDEDFQLQGAMDAIQDDAQAIADELDVGIDEVLEVLDPLLDVTDDDSDDSGDDGDIDNQDGDDDDGDGDGDDDSDDDDDDDDDMDMQDRVDALEERLTNVEDMVESAMQAEDFEEELSEELAEAREELASAETVQELEEAKEDLEKRLSELEEEPDDPKSLSSSAEEENGTSEGVSRPVATKARDGSVRF